MRCRMAGAAAHRCPVLIPLLTPRTLADGKEQLANPRASELVNLLDEADKLLEKGSWG